MYKLPSIIFFFFSLVYYGQDSITIKIKDSSSVKNLFLKSKLEVNARSVYMTTINEGDLKDDYAIASGIGLGLLTKSFNGLQLGISGFVIYNLLSSNINEPDLVTLGTNRYEVGLFDIQNINAKCNLIRLENLFLKYTLSKTTLTVGKIKLNTPFLNPQDGRMNTSMEEGAWLNINELKKIQITGGWIWNMSPRSTTQWYTVANSIGIYPSGISETGAKSNYVGNISSNGVGVANVNLMPNNNFKINLWDLLIDNVMNTSMLEINNEFGNKLKFYQGIMFIHQNALNNGGNEDKTKTYITKNAQSNAFSAQFGLKNKRVNCNINYTRITNEGRYLMPREWGKDPFYTFMPREKNDGFGNVHAATVKSTMLWLKGKFKTGLGYGYFLLPDVIDYRLNKYGMPSYHQCNFDAGYSFTNFFKGLELKCLVAYKLNAGETYNNLKYVYNKVNMANISFVVDFKF
jgi:hypothetical protein